MKLIREFKYLEFARIACKFVYELEAFDPDGVYGVNRYRVSQLEKARKRYSWNDRNWATGYGKYNEFRIQFDY